MKAAELNILYDSVVKNNSNNLNTPLSDNKLVIILDNKKVRMNRTWLTSPLVDFVKTNFNVANPNYCIKKKMRRSTLGTEQSFNLILESKNEVVLPWGTIGKLLRFCNTQKVDFEFRDKRKKSEDIPFTLALSC